VLADHVARNSLLPVVTVSGLQLSALLGGAVITETVFAWPGIGALLVESVGARDYSVVQAISVVVAIGVVLINVLTDLLYLRLDPRIRLGASA
jgi:peptide/nickel transport system permease protein